MKLKDNIAISENGFVFNPTTGESYTINAVGREVLHLLGEKRNEQHILAEMFSKFDADEITIEKDFYDFVSALKQYNLLVFDTI